MIAVRGVVLQKSADRRRRGPTGQRPAPPASHTVTREPGAAYRSRHDFVRDTPAVDGSWWFCWRDWLHTRSSGDVPARTPAAGFAAAPGTYVLET